MLKSWAGLLGLQESEESGPARAAGLREAGSRAGPWKEKEKQAEQAFRLGMGGGVFSISIFLILFSKLISNVS